MNENPNWHPSEKKLWAALCNFCNGARDSFSPISKWDDETWHNLGELCRAYNAWHVYMKETKGDLHVWEED